MADRQLQSGQGPNAPPAGQQTAMPSGSESQTFNGAEPSVNLPGSSPRPPQLPSPQQAAAATAAVSQPLNVRQPAENWRQIQPHVHGPHGTSQQQAIPQPSTPQQGRPAIHGMQTPHSSSMYSGKAAAPSPVSFSGVQQTPGPYPGSTSAQNPRMPFMKGPVHPQSGPQNVSVGTPASMHSSPRMQPVHPQNFASPSQYAPSPAFSNPPLPISGHASHSAQGQPGVRYPPTPYSAASPGTGGYSVPSPALQSGFSQQNQYEQQRQQQQPTTPVQQAAAFGTSPRTSSAQAQLRTPANPNGNQPAPGQSPQFANQQLVKQLQGQAQGPPPSAQMSMPATSASDRMLAVAKQATMHQYNAPKTANVMSDLQLRHDTLRWLGEIARLRNVHPHQAAQEAGVPMPQMEKWCFEDSVFDRNVTSRLRAWIKHYLDIQAKQGTPLFGSSAQQQASANPKQPQNPAPCNSSIPKAKAVGNKRVLASAPVPAPSSIVQGRHVQWIPATFNGPLGGGGHKIHEFNFDDVSVTVESGENTKHTFKSEFDPAIDCGAFFSGKTQDGDHLVPVRLEIEIDGKVLKDTLIWNSNDTPHAPEAFARSLVKDLDFPDEFVGPVANSIRDSVRDFRPKPPPAAATSEVYLIIIDIRVNEITLQDQFLWNASDPTNCAEEFARRMVADLRLPLDFCGIIAFHIREQVQENRKELWQLHDSKASFEDCDAYYGSVDPSAEGGPLRAPAEAERWAPTVITLSKPELDMAERMAKRRKK